MTAVDTVVDFDHHSPEFARARDEVLTELRATSPIVWTERYGGFWVVTSHALIARIMRDDKRFTVERTASGGGGITIPENDYKPEIVPGEVDGRRHEAYRRALNPFFAKPHVETMAAYVRGVVDELIDKAGPAGEFDAFRDLAREIPMRAVYGYMAIGDIEDGWGLFDSIEEARKQPTPTFVGEVIDRLRAIIRQKREARTDDLLGRIATLEDPEFSEEDLLSLCVGLILGGVRTTGDLLGHAFWQLEVDRDLRARLRADPTLIPAAVAEFLRMFTPAFGLARTALEDVEVGGVTVKAGQRVLNAFHAGNHDPAVFPEPEKVDIDRTSGRHLAFGMGTHFCLGSWLARMEAQIALEQVLSRIPDYRIDLARCERSESLGLRNGWVSMPAVAAG
jgi:cytochrome P450